MAETRFELVRFNRRRADRGAEAADLRIVFADGSTDRLWMSSRDVNRNIALWGLRSGLIEARDKYAEYRKGGNRG